MKNQELIERLEETRRLLIPSCFKIDMDSVKDNMLVIIDNMTTNTMDTADVVAVLEVFLAYLRQEEQS